MKKVLNFNKPSPRLPRFSAILLLTICLLKQTLAQASLDAGVQFGTANEKAGDSSVFRFTIKVPAMGDLVRTYFPSTVPYISDPANVEVCQESFFLGTTPIQNCAYNEAENMIEFPLPGQVGPGAYFTYELGNMRNPAYSQQLTGFRLQVVDSADPSTVLFENTDISIRVQPGLIYDQSLQTSSQQVAAEAKFNFEFKVTNPVPSGGFIEVSFPLNQIEVPTSESESRLSVAGGPWFTPSQNIWPYGIRFSVPPTGIEAGDSIVLELDEMTNPNTME